MGERVLLELSWLAWHCASCAQPMSGHLVPIKTEHPCWQSPSGAGERLARQERGGDPLGTTLSGVPRVGKLSSCSTRLSGTFSGL